MWRKFGSNRVCSLKFISVRGGPYTYLGRAFTLHSVVIGFVEYLPGYQGGGGHSKSLWLAKARQVVK